MTDNLKKSTEGKPAQHRFSRKRRTFHVLAFIVLALIFTDLYLEILGPSDTLQNYFRNELSKIGIDFKAEKIRFGLFGGIKIHKVEMREGKGPDAAILKADQIRVSISFTDIFRFRLPMNKFSVTNASLSVPVFPESGTEGLTDRIKLTDFNAVVKKDSGSLLIERGEGLLQKIRLEFSGKIDNIFIPISPQLLPLSAKAIGKKKISLLYFMRKIPLDYREIFMRNLLKINRKTFTENPVCKVKISLNARDFMKSGAETSIKVPPFTYGLLETNGISGNIILRDGILSLDNLDIALKNGFCRIDGKYDISKTVISGTVSGNAKSSDIILFLDDKSKDIIRDMKIEDVELSYQGDLSDYSVNSGKYTGELKLEIPKFKFEKVSFNNIAAAVSIKNGNIKGRIKSAILPHNGKISGDFTFKDKLLNGNFNGSACILNIMPFLSPKAEKFFSQNIDLKSAPMINFSASVSPASSAKGYKGNADISIPSIKIRGISFNELKTKLEFSDDYVKASDFSTVMDDGTRINGLIKFLITENIFSASVFCKGNPVNTIVLLEEDHRLFLNTFLKDIKWPSRDSLAEATLDLHYQWSDNPFYFLSGNVILTNFAYKGISFDYGAGRFCIASDNLVILPGIVLENKDGKAVISVAYDGRQKSGWKHQSQYIKSFDKPKGQLVFSLKSTIAGQDLLKIFYSNWKNEYLSFPGSINVSADGMIDLRNENNTAFKAVLNNAKCRWNKIPIGNIDADILYKEQKLELKKATAEVCGGNMNICYDFDFSKYAGNIDISFQGARFKELLDHVGIEHKSKSSDDKGVISGTLTSAISYDKEDRLLMNGSGKILLSNPDLWAIPFFGGFLNLIGQAWAINKFGNISELKGDYELKGDHLYTNSIRTDGSIIAIQAKGKYYWNTNEYDFGVKAELLKHLLPFKAMAYLLSPVTWLFEARVSGKGNDAKWE